MNCPGCKQPASADSVFCPHCGLGLAGTSACPGCGTALAPWERLCPSCSAAEKSVGEEHRALPPDALSPSPGTQASGLPADGDELSEYEAVVGQGRSADRRLFAGIGVAIMACAAAFYLLRDPAPAPVHAAVESAAVVKSSEAKSQQLQAQAPRIDPRQTDAQQVASLPPAEPSRPEGSAPSLQFGPPPTADDTAPPVNRHVSQMAADTERPACESRSVRAARSNPPPVRKAVKTVRKCPPSTPKHVVAAAPSRRALEPSPVVTAPVAAPVPEAAGWHAALKSRFAVCDRQPFVERTVCREKARWKYCSPSRWNKVPECGLITHASNN